VAATPQITSTPGEARQETGRGRSAYTPTDVPQRGWKDVLVRTKVETKADNIPLLSAGVAFYALLALVPGLVATVSIFGLAADPASIGRHVNDLLGAAPTEVQTLVQNQLLSITAGSHAKLGLGAVFGVLVALWSASTGMKHTLTALNAAYDEDETRTFVRLRAVSLLLTVGAVMFVIASVAVVAALPMLLDHTAVGTSGRFAIAVIRWPALGLAVIAGLAVLYRYGPDRNQPKWRWVSPGALFATSAWLVASVLFSVYTANFGKYNETYGSLGAVVVVMLWLFLTVAAVLVGAELNAELERQTLQDSTRGPDQPIGQRHANAADTVGATAEQLRQRTRARK
jgi:membrane protein